MNTNKYHSLEEFLRHSASDVEEPCHDGAGAPFLLKGKQIEAAILFTDMTNFSGNTRGLPPAATLILVNKFFTWFAAEGLRDLPGVIDKYIGDEIMVVFAKEFGSVDPLVDAVRCAVRMAASDLWGFLPHSGIAFGNVIVGEVGTPDARDVSVFGDAVIVASRLTGVKGSSSSTTPSVVLPVQDWGDRDIKTETGVDLRAWDVGTQVTDPKLTKNMPALDVYTLTKTTTEFLFSIEDNSTTTAADVARQELIDLVNAGKAGRNLL